MRNVYGIFSPDGMYESRASGSQGILKLKRILHSATLALFMALLARPGFGQQETGWQPRAQLELQQLFAALASGDLRRIERHLAEEFQLIRSNGATFDKRSYLNRSIPVIRDTPRFMNIKVTGQADIRVVTFNLDVDETIDGHTVENLAPQLIVFRDLGERWIVVASANLARLTR
jgi:hypothetical protein